jgi:hypothetical protein
MMNETNRVDQQGGRIENESITAKQMKETFEKMVDYYLASNPVLKVGKKTNEFEIRFGSNPRLSKPVSKIDYDNVIKKLYSCGFKCENVDGIQSLRIQSEFIEPRTGMTKMSNIRAEIVGTDLIQEYCRTNSLQKILDMPSTVSDKLKFTQKTLATTANGINIKPLDMTDFNFRVSHQLEEEYNANTNLSRNIISKWSDSKKVFRYMNRVRFHHPDYPIFADVSIVKTSKKSNKVPMPQYTIQEAEVFQNAEHYEIELEIDNTRVGMGTPFNTKLSLMDALRKCIRTVLSGLQGSNYPISYAEQDSILHEYMKMVHGDEYQKRRVTTKDFIGPSSLTLQMENIVSPVDQSIVANIRANYCVTDKADGERKLLFISKDGKLYLIDTNMNVMFTGMATAEKTMYNSIVDGENILHDKHSNTIHLYAAFDVYYINKRSVREYPFVSLNIEENENKQRLLLLQKMIELMKPKSVVEKKTKTSVSTDFCVKCKMFEIARPDKTIFECCSKILSNVKDELYEYNTDGLIFTPIHTGVGSKDVGIAGPTQKITWEQSFKWKPPQYNTIDFLVSVKKDKTGRDEVHHVFQDGKNVKGGQSIIQYKTLVLRCGFDERRHGYLNPCQDMIDEKYKTDDVDNEERYKPVPFQPTNPYDPNACFTNIRLIEDGSKVYMVTEEHEYFEEDTIVEFKYIMDNKDGWKWVPIRVRYDKTAELRNGMKNYGNAYHVANSNWHSIHQPIRDDMISTGNDIPETTINEDVYYNRSNEETSTQGLRDFHNLYVKKKLICGVSRRGDTLIDYAVGKAGDLSKWISSNLSFVYGIDVSKDNIHNHLDGACARYLTNMKKNKNIPDALFVTGNTGFNIRSGKAFHTEKDKQITNAIFGTGPKDVNVLGKGVYNQYGRGQSGFHVSSCQFALHYFFETKALLHGFLRNLAECTRIQGYFIGTCYDGMSVFNLLKNKTKGESTTIMRDDKKIFEVTKMYDETGFPEDDMSIGYPINVYQESINKVFREYLVNFEYFIRIMDDYGFVLIQREEAQQMGFPDSNGLFTELFKNMEQEIKQHSNNRLSYRSALYMTPEEKRISFLNRYFIFRKVRNVNADKMFKIVSHEAEIVKETNDEVVSEVNELHGAIEPIPVTIIEKPIIKTIRKTKKPKILIQQTEQPEIVAVTEEEFKSYIDPTQQPIIIRVKKPIPR